MRKYLMVLLLPLVVLAGACTPGGGDDEKSASQSPAQRLAGAKKALDGAQNIGFVLSTDSLPDGQSGLVSAQGTGTHAPTFKGEVTIEAGTEINAPIVALDGDVYAELPFVGWKDLDPADYGAPDPAQLMSRTDGVSSLFPQTDQPRAGEQTRDGEDVLTTISGTLPGSAMQRVFPSSGDGDFQVTYELTSANEPRRITIAGPFYPGTAPVTYVMTLDLQAEPVQVQAPN